MNELTTLIKRISSGEVLSEKAFNGMDIDEMLDLRDSADFEADWLRASNLLIPKITQTSHRTILDELREIVFKKIYSYTENSDMAGYVSDDFELIGAAVLLGVKDDWVNSLWNKYRNNKFPHTRLIPLEDAE